MRDACARVATGATPTSSCVITTRDLSWCDNLANRMDVLDGFHPLVAGWFRDRFGSPTEPQRAGWPRIAAGEDVLIAAPTGSGKTLAAFLACLDELRAPRRWRAAAAAGRARRSSTSRRSRRCRTTCSATSRRRSPSCAQRGARRPATRSPTSASRCAPATRREAERAKMAKRPPHILVTTPESLYILLTAARGPRGARPAAHGDRRRDPRRRRRQARRAPRAQRSSGSTGWCAQAAGRAPMRVGLSATQRPIERIARLLVGDAAAAAAHRRRRPPARARSRDRDHRRRARRGRRRTSSSGEIYDRIAELVDAAPLDDRLRQHAPARRARRGRARAAARRGARRRAPRLDVARAAARRRAQAQARARCKCAVATASLELGIDVGAVDLVVQLGSPRSIATLLQRVGRSGHRLGGTPKGRLFALTRDELVECAALVRGVAARRARRDRAARRAARHPRAADRRGVRGRGDAARPSSSRWCAARRPVRELRDDAARAGARDAGEGVAGPARPRRRVPAPRSRRRHAARAARRAARGDHRAARSPTTPTTRSCSGPRRRRSARSTRTSRSRARPATSSCSATRVAHPAHRGRPRARRGREGPAADDPVLARRGAGAHARAVRRGQRAARRDRRAARRRRRIPTRSRRGSQRECGMGRCAPRSRSVAYLAAGRSGARRAAAQGSAHRRALLRRGRRHAARHPRAVRRADQPRLGPGAAQEVLPDVRLRAAGGGDRRRHRALARPAAQLPARHRVRLRAVAPGRATRSCRRCSIGRCSTSAGAGTRRARWRVLRRTRRQEGAAAPHADARRGHAVACVFPQAQACGENIAGPIARCRITRSCSRRSATAWTRRWTATACATLIERLERGEIQLPRARHRRAVAAVARAPQRQPVRVPRRRAARGAPHARRALRRGLPSADAPPRRRRARRRRRSRWRPRRSRRPSAMRRAARRAAWRCGSCPRPSAEALASWARVVRGARARGERARVSARWPADGATRRGSRPSGSAPRARCSAMASTSRRSAHAGVGEAPEREDAIAQARLARTSITAAR